MSESLYLSAQLSAWIFCLLWPVLALCEVSENQACRVSGGMTTEGLRGRVALSCWEHGAWSWCWWPGQAVSVCIAVGWGLHSIVLSPGPRPACLEWVNPQNSWAEHIASRVSGKCLCRATSLRWLSVCCLLLCSQRSSPNSL